MYKTPILEAIKKLNKEKHLTPEQELIRSFSEELLNYIPNWDIICSHKLYDDTTNLYDDMRRKLYFLSVRIKDVREKWDYSYRKMAAVCGKSHAFILSAEQNRLKRIPREIGTIASRIGVSVPYLIGLSESQEEIPNLIQAYFWENPDSMYNSIRTQAEELIGLKTLFSPIMIEPLPFSQTKDEIIKLMQRDTRLASAIVKLFRANPNKRRIYTTILEDLTKL